MINSTIIIHDKEYKCHIIEQTNRARGTRYKAYGYFKDKLIEAQGPSVEVALKRLKQRAEIKL